MILNILIKTALYLSIHRILLSLKQLNIGYGLKSTPIVNKSSGLQSTPIINKKGENVKKKKKLEKG